VFLLLNALLLKLNSAIPTWEITHLVLAPMLVDKANALQEYVVAIEDTAD